MIFVTIGSMFPFDRLVRAMDDWAAENPGRELLAQVGAGGFLPAHMPWVRKLERGAYLAAAARAELLVAHAGMGTVITAAELGKPLVLLPRQAALGEHNNDHQADTAAWLRTRPGIWVADEAAALPAAIAAALAAATGGAIAGSIGGAPEAFLQRLRAFVAG